ncbi:MAG: hypothetical protein WC994_01820 [Brumimicrobium sp.]
MPKRVLTILLFLTCSFAFGQRDVSEAIGTPYVGIQYGANFPMGDLAERYGFFNAIGAHAGYKTKKNWVFGIDGNFFFGNKIKIEGLFDNLLNQDGLLIGINGNTAEVGTFFRGFHINGVVSKIIPLGKPNPNSGLMIQMGAGYLWHKLLIDSREGVVPQLTNEYAKGYDRLSIGFNTSEFIGYSYMADRGILNFYVGFYFQQGFTYNQRDIFWDKPNEKTDKGLRFEHILGVRVGWLIPIYKREPKDFYFN